MQRIKKVLTCLLLSIFVACILFFLEDLPFFQAIEHKLYDARMILRTPIPQDNRIVFVEMDQEAMHNLGRWPWPRSILANTVDTLQSLGAKQIIFDVTFSQPTQLIVEKEAIDNIFSGKEQVDQFIKNETGNLKAKETIPADDAIWSLDQIQNGFNEYIVSVRSRLKNTLLDNDLLLAESLQKSNSFIGYSFEVLVDNKDLDRQAHIPEIKKSFALWSKNNPSNNSLNPPEQLITSDLFSKEEFKHIFIRSKVSQELRQELATTLSAFSQKYNLELNTLRPDFNLAKKQLIEEMIFKVLQNNPDAKLTDIIYEYEILDKNLQNDFRNSYAGVNNEFVASKTFGISQQKAYRFMTARKMDPPFALLTKAVKHGGFLNGIPDNDGVLRSIPIFVQHKNKLYPHIALASILDIYKPKDLTLEENNTFVIREANVNGVKKDIHIPLSKDSRMLINWAGKWQDTYQHISIADIYRLFYLRETTSQEDYDANKLQEKESKLRKLIQDKICIIGLTAPGTHDYNPIPYESTYPMVGTHGNVLNSLLTQNFIVQANDSLNIAILLILTFLVSTCLALLSSVAGLIFILVAIAATSLTSLAFFSNGLWINLASPILLCLLSYIGITSYKFSTEEKSKREIKNAFSKYVSPDIIEEIVKDPSKLQLGGTKKELTVLFSDIRSFTTYSEKRSPEEVVHVLNEYLDAMTKVIIDHKGTLDKYVGDEIMAVFGAPNYEPPDISAKRAVTAAIHMLRRLKELHAKWAQEGIEPLDIGVGINTGDMVVGNMGSELRMDYTVIGDAVNLGARVEAVTRDYQAHLIITETTFHHVKDIITYEPLEAIKVKGKDIPVMIYNVFDLKKES